MNLFNFIFLRSFGAVMQEIKTTQTFAIHVNAFSHVFCFVLFLECAAMHCRTFEADQEVESLVLKHYGFCFVFPWQFLSSSALPCCPLYVLSRNHVLSPLPLTAPRIYSSSFHLLNGLCSVNPGLHPFLYC